MHASGICCSRARGVPRLSWGLAIFALFAALAPSRVARADRAVARALVEEGERLSTAGRSTVALERLERAIAEDPDYLPAYEAAAGLWLRAGQLDLVIRHLARVTLRHPRYGFGWYTLAFAYRRAARHDLAVLCYREYLEIRPEEADPYFGMATSLVALGRREEAASAFARYLELEHRPEQREFVARARSELLRLRGPQPAAAHPIQIAWRLMRRTVSHLDGAARAARRTVAPRRPR